MTIASKYHYTTETRLAGVEFTTFSTVLRHRTTNQTVEQVKSSDTHLLLRARQGFVRFADHQKGVKITLFATRPERLQMLRDGLIDTLANAMPGMTESLRWTDTSETGTPPPNLHFATVCHVTPLGPAFLRIRVKADDLSSFQNDAIHFRFVLPPAGLQDVEWPYVGENGATVWPQGDKALHRPVYTTRWIDHDAGLMDFDVFLHDGGRVTDWAKAIRIGETVAFMGPGGGGIPQTDKIIALADETAFPAIARIAESLPAHSTGQLVLMAAGGIDCGYPIVVPDGVKLTWIDPEDRMALAEIAIAASAAEPDHYLWFAAEKAAAQQVREGYKTRGGNPQNAYIAGYWLSS
ncbi:siderophore-interacting protein [Sedimentitalea sp.]|uniref:siderophore-interacting protein n=1 Tax=Sedimentitalea sp. TaxID=2048915 RepID=UPI003297DF0F